MKVENIALKDLYEIIDSEIQDLNTCEENSLEKRMVIFKIKKQIQKYVKNKEKEIE